jgi:hypothetical protein
VPCRRHDHAPAMSACDFGARATGLLNDDPPMQLTPIGTAFFGPTHLNHSSRSMRDGVFCGIFLALLWQILTAVGDSQISFPMIHGWSAFGGPTMRRSTASDWQGDLGRWLKPFLDRLDHKARRRMCPLGGEKRINGPPPQPSLPAVRHAIVALLARPPPQRCPHCRRWIRAKKQRE